MKQRAILFLSLLAAMWLMEGTALAQCAMCRTALEQSAEGKAIAGSFRHGILLLLAAPYLIFGTAGIVLFRAYRRKAARRSNNLYIP